MYLQVTRRGLVYYTSAPVWDLRLGKGLNQQTPRTEASRIDSKHNGELQLPPTVPNTEFGEEFQANVELHTKPSSVPNVESGNRIKGWGFPLENLKIVV